MQLCWLVECIYSNNLTLPLEYIPTNNKLLQRSEKLELLTDANLGPNNTLQSLIYNLMAIAYRISEQMHYGTLFNTRFSHVLVQSTDFFPVVSTEWLCAQYLSLSSCPTRKIQVNQNYQNINLQLKFYIIPTNITQPPDPAEIPLRLTNNSILQVSRNNDWGTVN